MLHVIFIVLIENPHMKRLYSTRLRGPSPLEAALDQTLSHAGVPTEEVRSRVRDIQRDAAKQILEVYSQMVENSLQLDAERTDFSSFFERFSTNAENSSDRKEKMAQTMASLLARKGHSDADEDVPRSPQLADVERSVELEAPENVSLGAPITVGFRALSPHHRKDWIGIYAKDTPSLPGLSRGLWEYVGEVDQGQVVFRDDKVPHKPGEYEIRYHTHRPKYCEVRKIPLVIVEK
jgi:phosphatidylethanolamine N-methyltransferase